ncbi:MAG: replicative DNA helicase [Patescibacteria group bacterium]|nr:replicative DNA helicase [Patescibacteria group bacterium]
MAKRKEVQKSMDKVLPHNLEAEEALLGSVFINTEGLYKIMDVTNPEDFYSPANKEIYDAVLTLFAEKSPIDLVTITEILERRGVLDSVGGATYLSRIVNSVPTASHIVQYANIVKEKKILRDLITTAHEISAMGYQEDEKIDITLDSAEQLLFKVAQKTMKQGFIPLKNMLAETFERIDYLHKNKGELRGVATGFDDLDFILGGLQKSDLVILAARPSMGKTSLALNVALNAAVNVNIPVAIFSLEMSKDQLVDRLISSAARVNAWKLRTGELAEDDFPKIGEAMDILNRAPIFIDDSANISIMEMRAKARRLKSESGLGLIIVDYLQLMGGGGNIENRVQEVSEISRSLKGLARELDVPVLALSQLSRAVEARPDKRPLLSDLRESGSIEQDADVVMFVYREYCYNKDTDKPNIAEILVRKHRNGPTGDLSLYFVSEQMRFANLDKKHSES